MTTLSARAQPHTLEDYVLEAIRFKEPAIKKLPNLLERFNESVQRFDSLAADLCTILTQERCPFVVPKILTAGSEMASMPYADAVQSLRSSLEVGTSTLASVCRATKVGRIEWTTENACRFSFNELRTVRGVFSHTITRRAHTHDIVRARQHRLPAFDIAKPLEAQKIIAQMGEPLREASRIVTGTLVVRSARIAETLHEATLLGRGVEKVSKVIHGAASKAQSAMQRIADAINPIGGTGGNQVALRDPALVVGFIVLYGWEEIE